MNLTTFKLKKLAAKKGYDLLKSKADALKVSSIFFGKEATKIILTKHILFTYCRSAFV